jgi:hypothetical protein
LLFDFKDLSGRGRGRGTIASSLDLSLDKEADEEDDDGTDDSKDDDDTGLPLSPVLGTLAELDHCVTGNQR